MDKPLTHVIPASGLEERLVKFACVVECGSFTDAARQLRVSQPALSVAIAQLERALGTLLLVRGARPLQVTSAGQRAYVAAKRITAATGTLDAELAELGHHKRARTVGMTDSLAQGLLRDNAFLQAVTDADSLSLVVHNSRFLQAAVERDELDMAFAVAGTDVQSETLTAHALGSEQLVMVAHPLEVATAVAGLQAGRVERFISYDQPSVSRALIMQTLAARRLECRVRYASTSPEVMLRLVLLRQGVAVLPVVQVGQLVSEGKLATVAMHGKPLTVERPIVCMVRAGKRVPAAVQSFERLVSTLLATARLAG